MKERAHSRYIYVPVKKSIDAQNEPITYKGVMYKHGNVLEEHCVNDDGAMFVTFDEHQLRCNICGTTADRDTLVQHSRKYKNTRESDDEQLVMVCKLHDLG